MPFLPKPAGPGAPVSRRGHISASQTKTADSCLRKWAFEKVWKMPRPYMPYHRFGHTLHAVGDRYLSQSAKSWDGLFPAGWDDGLAPEEPAMIRTMAERAVEDGIWRVRDHIMVEHPIVYLVGNRFRDERGLPWLATPRVYVDDKGTRAIGKIDSLIDGSPLPAGWDDLAPFIGFVDDMGLWENPYPLVADHKTAKNRRYTLTSEKLVQDRQMLAYAIYPLAVRTDTNIVQLRHNVFLKNPEDPQVFQTEGAVTVGQVVKEWEDIIDISTQMRVVYDYAPLTPGPPEHRADNWHRVPGAYEAGHHDTICTAYGGCPYLSICKRRQAACEVVEMIDREAKRPPIKPIKIQPRGLNLTNHRKPSGASNAV